MEPVVLLNHGINFVAPAVWVAMLISVLGGLFMKNGRSSLGFIAIAAINIAVSSTVLVAGLVVFGHDGKMLTYLAMTGASATTYWILLKGWRG